MKLQWLNAICIISQLVVAHSSEWTVETNSLRVKEPSSLQGDHDAAIGDVSDRNMKH